MKKEYIKASQFVANMSKKYGANRCYVWDILGEEYNIIKGIGALMDATEAQEAERIIKTGISGD